MVLALVQVSGAHTAGDTVQEPVDVVHAFTLAIFLLVLTSTLPSISLAQTSTAPTGHAQVIAQGVDLMPRVPVAWRMPESQAAPTDEAEFFPRTLGFTIGVDDPILVTDDDSDALTLLHEGEASFHPEGASERRSSTTNATVEYVNIELIVADAVDSPESVGSSRLTFTGEDFRVPRGYRDLQLMRDVLAPAEEGAISGSGDAPSLLYVSGGALQVTGSLVIYQSDCPYGTDPVVDTSACATSTDPWAVTVTNDATGEPWDLLFDGVAYDTGTFVLETLPAGSYSIFVSSNENWSLSYPTNIDVSADDETYVTVSSDDLRAP